MLFLWHQIGHGSKLRSCLYSITQNSIMNIGPMSTYVLIISLFFPYSVSNPMIIVASRTAYFGVVSVCFCLPTPIIKFLYQISAMSYQIFVVSAFPLNKTVTWVSRYINSSRLLWSVFNISFLQGCTKRLLFSICFFILMCSAF